MNPKHRLPNMPNPPAPPEKKPDPITSVHVAFDFLTLEQKIEAFQRIRDSMRSAFEKEEFTIKERQAFIHKGYEICFGK